MLNQFSENIRERDFFYFEFHDNVIWKYVLIVKENLVILRILSLFLCYIVINVSKI